MNGTTRGIGVQGGKLLGLVAGLIIFATGCQTYKPPMQSWRQGDVQGAAKQIAAMAEKHKANKDAIIWRLEQGAALRAAGQYREANVAFDAAEAKIDEYDEKAKVSIGHETAALLSNQANLPYEGRDYDRVMLNAYKALDYLQLGEPEKARVELMRASQRQQDMEANNQRRIEKLAKATEELKDSKDKDGKNVKGADQGKAMADKANSDTNFINHVKSNYGYLDEFRSKTNYVNPFVYYVDAIYFLTANADHSDLERARDSFRFTLGSIGENKFIDQDLEMVDGALQGTPVPPTTYVIFETGSAPIRDQIRIDVPLFLVGVKEVPYVGAAFPTLKFQSGQLTNLFVTANGISESTLPLASMDAVVGQAFKDELPTIITKTLVSTAVKAAAAYGVNKGMEKQNAIAQLVVKIVLVALQASVNIADTRTWNTLPKEFQFCRIPTPPDGKIQISGPDGVLKTEVAVETNAVNLIYVKSINSTNALIVSQLKLRNAQAPSAGASLITSATDAMVPNQNPTPAGVPKEITEPQNK